MGAGAVFISYRRGDSEGQARALSIQLGDLIGRDSVFMDVDSIALGRDFRQVLQQRLQACDIVLVLIGPNWLEAKDSEGNRRLENPADFVRQEIAAALKRNIVVTPVLLQGANMPGLDRMPPDLQDLAYRHGFEISHTRWVSDVKEMFKRLGLMPRTNPYQVSMGRLQPSSTPVTRFAGAGTVAQCSAATDGATPTTTDTCAATGSNGGNAVTTVAPADGFSKSSAPPGKQMRRAIIAAAGLSILAVLTLAGYISTRKKTTDTTVAAATVPAATVAATTVAATTVASTTVPATTVPEATVPVTTVPEVTVPEISKMQWEDAEAKITAANLNAVAVKDWNQDAEQDSVIESEPPPGTKVNPGDTVTLHVSAPGGWVHFGKEDELGAGKTFATTKSMSLHVVDDKKSRQLGSVEAGKSVRVIEVGGHGWAKVVVID